MGIPIEFNPDLALRNIKEFNDGKREKEECVPENLEVGKVYDFLKKEQRIYWLFGPIPLIETEGKGVFSSPLAVVQVMEATHFVKNNEVCTKGKYKIIRVYENGSGADVKYDIFQRNGFDE